MVGYKRAKPCDDKMLQKEQRAKPTIVTSYTGEVSGEAGKKVWRSCNTQAGQVLAGPRWCKRVNESERTFFSIQRLTAIM